MTYSDNITEYMIVGLCIAAFFIIFSGLLKRIVKIALRAAAGLLGVYVLNTLLTGSGIAVGINLINGLFIGIFGFPALAGLYIIQFFIK